ncbi:uncharacterized protein LOC141684227 [Apium graveolens]|uniref:uncharacterized protein LOC141684227 n=1 Tax=Apium graveolens TaxID=4045 RepID=UPI003D7B681F
MMRYQGLSPENLPLSNGKRSHWRTCKEDDGIIGRDENDVTTKPIPNFVESHKGLPKIRSSAPKTAQDQNFSTFSSYTPPKTNHDLNNSTTPPLNGDMLLQWGHRKRSRISRSVENRAAGAGSGLVDDSSSSSSTQLQAMMKVPTPRRSITLPTPATTIAIETKISSHANIMPPPSSILPNTISTSAAVTNSSTSNGKVGNHKSSSKDNSSFVNRRNSEDRSVGGNGSHPPRNTSSSSKGVIAAAAPSSRSKVLKRSPQKVLEKNDHVKIVSHAATTAVCSSGLASSSDEKMNGLVHQEQVKGIGMDHQENHHISPQEAGCSNTTSTTNHTNHGNTKIVAATANGGGEVFEWPRVLIPLTRKEKEEDFLLMKGTKLPHRPKKRPKAVDRMLQYCFPGTWLADVTKARYEVKEKKGTTKKPKRRGLKGMESMESDSE